MADPQSTLFNNLDEAVCRCPRCTAQAADWPDWATPPSSDWRPIETVAVVGGRL